MPALSSPSPHFASLEGEPSARRLLAGAIVAAVGAIVLSVAVGAYVATTRTTLPSSAASDAHALASWIPAIVTVGLAHFMIAAAMLRGRAAVRLVAAALVGIVAIASGIAAAMLVAGVDPFGWS